MHRVLIAVSSEIYAYTVARRLGPDYDVRICNDGRAVLTEIESFRPEALVLHTGLSHKSVLSILQQMPCNVPLIIALTNYVDSKLECRLLAFGVQQILIMPTANTLCLCLQDLLGTLAQEQTGHTVEQRIRLHLHILSFQPHRDGYTQLCKGLPLLCQEPNQPLSKQLYPAIAKATGCSDGRSVEHSIREAICAAWENRDDTVWNRYFPPNAEGTRRCPSNKQFLLRLVETILEEASL